MLDKDTIDMLDKLAAKQETGASQVKKKEQVSVKNHEGAGAGLGAVLGAGAGALSKKYKALTTAAGAIGGSLIGKALGKRTHTKSYQKMQEGQVKKQDRGETASIPRLNDKTVLKSIGYDKKK